VGFEQIAKQAQGALIARGVLRVGRSSLFTHPSPCLAGGHICSVRPKAKLCNTPVPPAMPDQVILHVSRAGVLG